MMGGIRQGRLLGWCASRPTDWLLIISFGIVGVLIYGLDDLGAIKQANRAEGSKLEAEIARLQAGRRGFEKQIEEARRSLKAALEERAGIIRENEAIQAILRYTDGYDVSGARSRTVTASLTRAYPEALWDLTIVSNNPNAVATFEDSVIDILDPRLGGDDASVLELLTLASHIQSVGRLKIRGCVIRRAHQDAIWNLSQLGAIELEGCSVEDETFEVPKETHSFDFKAMKGEALVVI